MAVASRAACEPVSSGEFQAVDLERAEEVERRHHLLAAFLELTGDDALILQRPSNFAWLTCGGTNCRPGAGDAAAALFITPDARVALCNAVDSAELFDFELPGLGFQLKERPWDEPRQVLLNDLCRGRRVATDVPSPGLRDVGGELADFRRALGPREWAELRGLSRLLTHAIEATARHFSPGDSEAEVAGQLAHRLLRHQVTPVRIQVIADGRGRRYRHWGFSNDSIDRCCVISALVRRRGLHCGATRTVSLGQPPAALVEAHQRAALVAATAFYFSQAGWELAQTWRRIARIYEKYGAAEEWHDADQGEVLGYEPVEAIAAPRATYRLSPGTPVFWHPSVQAAAVGETILVHADRTEIVTQPEDWPQLSVNVKGTAIEVPDILCREL